MKTVKSPRLWDMIADTIRATGPTDLQLTFSGKSFQTMYPSTFIPL